MNAKLDGRFPMWGGDPWVEPLANRERERRLRKRWRRTKIRNFLHPWRLRTWENRLRAILFLRPVNKLLRRPARGGALARSLGAAESISRT